MRENKYRGRRSYDKKWIYGSLLIDCDGDLHIVESKVVEKDGHHIQIDSDFPMFFDNETIGQFTGLHDKNGVKIYEGDLVDLIYSYKKNAVEEIGVISWDNYYSKFVLMSEDRKYTNSIGIESRMSIEVIGNIHESEDK